MRTWRTTGRKRKYFGIETILNARRAAPTCYRAKLHTALSKELRAAMSSLTRVGNGFTKPSVMVSCEPFQPRITNVQVDGMTLAIACAADVEAAYPVLPREYRTHMEVSTPHRGDVLLCQCDQGEQVLSKRHAMGIGLKLACSAYGASGVT